MRTNRPKPLLFLVLALVVIAMLGAACGSDDDVVDAGDAGSTLPGDTTDPGGDDGGTRPTLKGIWVLQSFTLDGAAVALPDGPIDMEIELGRIGGTGGCNSFGGQIDAGDAGTLIITDMAWTEMACADSSRMDFESIYLPTLAGVTRWEASPDGIVFSGDSAVLAYGPGEPPTTLPFEGTVWTLDTIFSGDGVERAASTTDRSRPEVTVVIDDGVVTLTSDDCGPITLTLNYEDGTEGNLNVADATGKPTCEDAASNMTAAIDGFWEAGGFMVSESRLTLIGLPGELIGFRGEV